MIYDNNISLNITWEFSAWTASLAMVGRVSDIVVDELTHLHHEY